MLYSFFGLLVLTVLARCAPTSCGAGQALSAFIQDWSGISAGHAQPLRRTLDDPVETAPRKEDEEQILSPWTQTDESNLQQHKLNYLRYVFGGPRTSEEHNDLLNAELEKWFDVEDAEQVVASKEAYKENVAISRRPNNSTLRHETLPTLIKWLGELLDSRRAKCEMVKDAVVDKLFALRWILKIWHRKSEAAQAYFAPEEIDAVRSAHKQGKALLQLNQDLYTESQPGGCFVVTYRKPQ